MKVSKLAKRLDFSSAIRRNEVWLFVEMWTDLESVIQSEVSQIEKNTYHVLVHICGIYKNGTGGPICRQKQRHRCREWMSGHSGGDELKDWS